MEWFKVYTYWGDAVDMLTVEEAGRLLKNIFDFVRYGESPKGEGREDLMMTIVIPVMKRDISKYESGVEEEEQKKEHIAAISKKRSEAGRKGGVAKNTRQAKSGKKAKIEICQRLPETENFCHDLPGTKNIEYKNTESENQETKNQEERISEERNEICVAAETEEDGGCSSVLPPAVPELPVIAIPLINGTEFPVFQRDVDEYAALYPDVNVIQELRNMRGWCLANPTRRKTKKGIRAFINTWLKKAQQEAEMKPDVPENPFLAYARGEKDCEVYTL